MKKIVVTLTMLLVATSMLSMQEEQPERYHAMKFTKENVQKAAQLRNYENWKATSFAHQFLNKGFTLKKDPHIFKEGTISFVTTDFNIQGGIYGMAMVISKTTGKFRYLVISKGDIAKYCLDGTLELRQVLKARPEFGYVLFTQKDLEKDSSGFLKALIKKIKENPFFEEYMQTLRRTQLEKQDVEERTQFVNTELVKKDGLAKDQLVRIQGTIIPRLFLYSC